jgi:uncharacterized protein with HEPN domain
MHDIDLDREISILKYLLEQIAVLEMYTNDFDEDIFLRDIRTKDAVLTRLIVIGEYGPRINDILKERFNEIDWIALKKARNFYAHVYRGIDWILVWNVIQNEIPLLKGQIESVIEILEKENNGKTN